MMMMMMMINHFICSRNTVVKPEAQQLMRQLALR